MKLMYVVTGKCPKCARAIKRYASRAAYINVKCPECGTQTTLDNVQPNLKETDA